MSVRLVVIITTLMVAFAWCAYAYGETNANTNVQTEAETEQEMPAESPKQEMVEFKAELLFLKLIEVRAELPENFQFEFLSIPFATAYETKSEPHHKRTKVLDSPLFRFYNVELYEDNKARMSFLEILFGALFKVEQRAEDSHAWEILKLPLITTLRSERAPEESHFKLLKVPLVSLLESHRIEQDSAFKLLDATLVSLWRSWHSEDCRSWELLNVTLSTFYRSKQCDEEKEWQLLTLPLLGSFFGQRTTPEETETEILYLIHFRTEK